MANRCKVGLDYFPFDATFFEDDKIQLIHAEHGSKGVMVAIKLLCKIYKEGYFYRWGDDECLLFVKNAGVEFEVDFVNQVIASLLKRKFFDKDRLEKYGILTSAGIQKRYFDATVRYKKINVILEYLIIVPPTRENVCIIRIDVDINPKNVDTNQHSNRNNNESKNETVTGIIDVPFFESSEDRSEKIIPDMYESWLHENPNYPKQESTDFTALGEIILKFKEISKVEGDPYRDGNVAKIIKDGWVEIISFIGSHDFYSTKSLKMISNNIQSIIIEYQAKSVTKRPISKVEQNLSELEKAIQLNNQDHAGQ